MMCCFFLLATVLSAAAQLNRYKVCVVAFYNLENLYDTVNNPIVNDDEFTPAGDKHYTAAIYADKLTKLATVLSSIGSDYSPDGPALLGVAEIENDTVLSDLVNHPLLRHRHYQFVHYDSKDSRGIDVALLYQAKYFKPLESEPLFVNIPGRSKDYAFTRDILYVKGLLDGETVHIYVNHWPSRRGGEARSSPAREAAATVCREHLEKVWLTEPAAKLLIMGDLNDDPDNRSVTVALKARGDQKEVQTGDLFNPWFKSYRQGTGTLANRDSWGLFDQIIISAGWLNTRQKGFYFSRQHFRITADCFQF